MFIQEIETNGERPTRRVFALKVFKKTRTAPSAAYEYAYSDFVSQPASSASIIKCPA